ncbi:unnamed protein product [Allacma fusca]|uniref:Uncharacterized protein n=1 Tax=Allacma fusca TaxID=39272 RepID=A0A8J2KDA5_9HEXA|nr:unnamed protein product [Allacma fusca]
MLERSMQVPAYMAKVDLIHDAVIRGSLRETQALLDKRKLATGRDAVGRGLLHKAVLYNHKAVIEWLGKKYPETLHIKDNEARTALHYTAASKDPDELYAQLTKLGAKETIDIHGRKPNYYINHPENLDIEGPRSLSNSRIKRPRLESTPNVKPISSTITRAQIRIWIHERDVGKLEKIVWNGHGDKLLLETTNNAKVKKFLLNVPHLLSKIKSIHSAAINNDVETIKEIRSKTEIPEVFTAKDSHGLTALHKAAGLGHRTIVEWFLYDFPNQLINDQDNDGRTPLHYSAKEPSTYNFLVKAGASEAIIDTKGKTPAYYKRNTADLDGRHLRNVPDAPRVTGELTPWDRVVTSPGAILDQKRRISNGEFNDEPHHQPPEPKKTIYDSDGYNGDTEGKYEIPDDIGHFDVEVAGGQLLEDNDDDFEPPVNDDDEFEAPLKNRGDKSASENVREPTPDDDDSIPDLTPPPTQQTASLQLQEEPQEQLEPQEEFVEEVEEVKPEPEEQPDPEPPELPELPELPVESEQTEEDTNVEEAQNTSQLDVDEDVGGGITDEQMEDNFIDDSDGTPEESGQDPSIDAEDMEKLVELVLDGKGNELLNIKSRNPEVQEFITNIPAYMAKIASIHAAAASGNLRDLQTILDRKRLALARDPNGLVPLHKAVLNGHSKVIRYLASNYNQSINVRDNNGRTPLHYAATLSDSGVTYKALIGAGADPNIKDVSGNTPGIYLRNKDLLSHADLTRAITNSVMIPSAVMRKHAETWQRPPSGNHMQLRSTNPVSQKTLELLKEAYKNLIKEESIWARILNRLTNQNRSHIPKEYIQKYLTPQVFSSLSDRTTSNGATLLDVIKFYPQAFIVAPDAHSYIIFKELFYPVMADHAKFHSPIHPKVEITEPNLGEFSIPIVDVPSKFVTQVRLQLSRNIQPFSFLPLMKVDDLFEVEKIIRTAEKAHESLERTYLEDLDREKRKQLESKGFWFPQETDYYNQIRLYCTHTIYLHQHATKLSRFWPKARAFYTSEDLTRTIWVNGQDHMDIVITSIYGKLEPMFRQMHEIYKNLKDYMEFHYSSQFGFLTVDPFRAGSALKINFTIRLPSLMQERSELASKCDELDLYVVWKGSSDYVELENKTSVSSEIELLTRVANSINTIIDLETKRARELFFLEQKRKKLKK